MNTNMLLPPIGQDFIDEHACFFLFETSLVDPDNYKSYIFIDPIEIIQIDNFSDVFEAFEHIEKCATTCHIAGYFAYELGYFFERHSFVKSSHDKEKHNNSSFPFPLIYVGIFRNKFEFNHRTGKWKIDGEAVDTEIETAFHSSAARQAKNFKIKNLHANIAESEYNDVVNTILNHIGDGDTYQVNYTFKYKFAFSGCPSSFYETLKNSQNVPYGAFLKFDNTYILSLSPELFFKRNGDSIISKPMKGTIQRGKTLHEDSIQISKLQHSAKDLAENTMIADLIRNDFGRISQYNTITVPELHTIEKYNTIFQMTSTVTGTLKRGITYFDIFKSLFPCGSVTGAPKIRTMRIIGELEKEYRNVYCGALGFISPGSKAVFNVPIRTLVLDNSKGEMGVGSGIVADSRTDFEYNECILKTRFLTKRYPSFRLIETLLWDEGYTFLGEHLNRMYESAVYFNYCCPVDRIKRELLQLEHKFIPGNRFIVRILLSKPGSVEYEYSKIDETNCGEPGPTVRYTAISKNRTNHEDLFLYHKTDNRGLYNSEYKEYSRRGYFDVIFKNTKGEITEGAITNIFVRQGQKYYTPPVTSGLLNGIYRSYFIKTNFAEEKILYENDLLEADVLYLCNSVRGLIEVKIK